MSKQIVIYLANPKAFWRPGDVIAGQVQFDCAKQVDTEEISICLRGESYAEYTESSGTGKDRTTRTYRSKVQLFYLYSVLFQGPFTLSPTSMSWPFQFTIPMNCSLATGDILQEDFPYDIRNEQPLPLAFTSHGASKKCRIEYSLDAVLRTSSMFSRNAEFKIPLQIVAPGSGPIQQRINELFNPLNFRSFHLLPEKSGGKLTLKEKMQSVFKSSTLPNASFTAKLELPEVTYFQGVICPALSLYYNPDSSSVKMPEVTLTSFSLSIEYFVSIRVKRYGRDFVREWRDSRLMADFTGRVVLTDRFDVSQLFSQGITVPDYSTTFQTYNIAVGCCWKAKYTIECAKESLKTKVLSNCIVLPP